LEKLAQKYSPNLGENNAQTPKFIGSEKLAVGVLSGLSVDRPADRPTVIFQTVWAIGRPGGRPSQDTESNLSVRSTARSAGAFPESRALWTVDRVGRPAILQSWRARLCTSVDRVGRPTSALVDLVGRLVDWLKPGTENLGIKTWSFWLT